MPIYDKYYKDENYFGGSYKELLAFFTSYSPKGTILDLGCGQGRDSIELAKLGYKVTGVDISSVGINQMIDTAMKLKLDIIGLVNDIYTFDSINKYDTVLLDSIFHFYKNDVVKETQFLNKILHDMSKGSVFCNLMIKSSQKEKYLKTQISNSKYNFEVLYDSYATYPEANAQYHMYIIKKSL